jgi:hypothetical protein
MMVDNKLPLCHPPLLFHLLQWLHFSSLFPSYTTTTQQCLSTLNVDNTNVNNNLNLIRFWTLPRTRSRVTWKKGLGT